jgi:hypothetical protein
MTGTESKWAERVREWKASGRTAKAFAEGRDFKASTLVYWASCLRRGRVGAARPQKRQSRVRMVRMVAAAKPASGSLTVRVGTAQVEVRSGFDRVLLRELLDALGGPR